MQDIERKLIEAAIASGRKIQSSQTQFVHWHPIVGEGERHDAIPSYENMLFVLALFRGRKSELVQEAKLILKRLLSYQGEFEGGSGGNFPIYLHEHPECHDRWHGVKLLSPLYWIIRHFNPILGDELRKESAAALEKITLNGLVILENNQANYFTALRIASGGIAAARLLDLKGIEERCRKKIDELNDLGGQTLWYTRKGIAEMIVSLQMLYGSIADSPWHSFWKHVEAMWHPRLRSYRGPAQNEWTAGYRPEPTLYDIFMNAYSGLIPEFEDRTHPILLGASLVFLGEDKLEGASELKLEDNGWMLYSTESYAYSIIEVSERMDRYPVGFHPLYFQWTHDGQSWVSLTCEGGRFDRMQFRSKEGEVELEVNLSESSASENPLDNRELVFYFTADKELKAVVEGIPSTTFRLGDAVHIGKEPKLYLRMTLLDGKGDFIGHIIPGNRPSQKLRSKNSFSPAFDWQVILRTVRKEGPCKIRVSLGVCPTKMISG